MGSGGSDNKDSMKMSGKMAADSKFMMMAAMSDMNEIGLSNMALQKSSNEDVKKLAQMMVDDHTKASEELKSLAMSKNVTLPTDADAKHKMMMDKMNSMSGMDFDMMYVKAMVKDHEKAVKMFQKESMSGKDADAKAFAAKTLPTLQGHLTMAQSMSGKMKGGMKSGKMSGDKMSGM
jgi:putative membrane protein